VLAKQRGQVRIGNEIAADGERAGHLEEAARLGKHPHPRQAQERLRMPQGFRRCAGPREAARMRERITSRPGGRAGR
jgi:hypothetical protein